MGRRGDSLRGLALAPFMLGLRRRLLAFHAGGCVSVCRVPMSQEKAAEIIDLKASRAAPEAGGETAGEFLANARRAAGLDLAAVSAATKVKISHLEAIEASEAAALPATPYAIGFVKVYARFLGLDADALARQFKADIGADTAPPAEQLRREAEAASAEIGGGAKLASIFGVVAIIVFMIWAAVQIAGGGERETRAARDAGGAPGVILKEDAAPALQPKPSEGSARNLPTVAVTEGEVAPSDVEAIAPPASEDTASARPESERASGETEAFAETAADTPPENEIPAEAAEAAAPAEALREAAVTPERDEALRPATRPAEREEQPAPRAARREEPPAPVVVEARLIRSIAPRYPNNCARNAGEMEKVTVIFDITAEGRTANARVVNSTNACFNESALSALGRWRFDPKMVDGAPRPDLGKQATLNFQQ